MPEGGRLLLIWMNGWITGDFKIHLHQNVDTKNSGVFCWP